MKLILVCITLVKLTAGDFGLPVRIVPLQKTVQTAIGTGVKPLQSALTAKEQTFRYRQFQQANSNKASLAKNVIAATQATSQSLLAAVQDATGGPTGTFAKLTKALEGAGQKLGGARSVGQYFEVNFAGSQFGALVARMNVEHGAIREFVATLSTAASNTAKAGSVTAQRVQQFITAADVGTLGNRVSSFMKTVNLLAQEVQRFDATVKNLTNILVDFKNASTFASIFMLGPLKSMLRTSKIKMTENVNDYVETVTDSYNSILKETPLKNSAAMIDRNYIRNVTSNLTTLQSIETYCMNQTNNFTELYQKSLNKSYELSLDTIVKSVANSTLDKFKINGCFNANPKLINQLSKAQLMGQDCTNHLSRAAPATRLVVDRFMTMFYAFVMQPISDFSMCNATIEKEFCVSYFETNYNPNTRPHRQGVVEMLAAMSQTAFNNAEYAVFRMEQCYEYAGKVYQRVLTELTIFISDCVSKKSA